MSDQVTEIKQSFKASTEFTRVFDEFSDFVQGFFREQVEFASDEIPLLAYYKPADCWFLITTHRAVWTNPDNSRFELLNEDIAKVQWSNGPENWPGIDPNVSEEDLRWASPGPWLRLVDFSGKVFHLHLEQANLRELRHFIWRQSGGWKQALPSAIQANREAASTFPETGSDQYKLARIERSLLSYGQSYSTKFFKSLTPDLQEFFRSKIATAEGELFVYAIWLDEETWFCATTRRVAWSSPGSRQQIELERIARIQSIPGEFVKLNFFDQERNIC